MQGRVMKVTKMKPTEILGLLEETAGTKMYEMRKAEAQRTLDRKEPKWAEIETVLNEDIKPKVEKLYKESQEYNSFAVIESDIEKYKKFRAAREYIEYRRRFESGDQQLCSLRDEAAQTQLRFDELKAQMDEITQRRAQLVDERARTGGPLTALRSERETLERELARLQSIVKDKAGTVEDTRHRVSNIGEKVKKLERKEESTKAENHEERSAMEAAEKELTEARDELDRAETQLTTMLTGCANIGERTGSLREELKVARSKLSELDTAIYTNRSTHKALLDELKEYEATSSHSLHEWKTALAETEKMATQIEELQGQMDDIMYKPNEDDKLNRDFDTTSQECDTVCSQLQAVDSRISSLCTQYHTPAHLKDKVLGHLFELFKIKEERLNCATALQMIGGAKLSYIVVDNKDTSKQLMNHNNFSHSARRVTVLPFMDIKVPFVVSRQQLTAARRAVGSGPTDDSRVLHGVDLIDFDMRMTKAIEYCYAQTLICSHADIARKVTFQSGLRQATCTLDGDMFNPTGAMHGGTTKNLQKLALLHRERCDLRDRLKRCNHQLSELGEARQEMSTRRQKYCTIEVQLTFARKNLESKRDLLKTSKSGSERERLVELQQQTSECEAEHGKFNRARQATVKLCDRLEEDIHALQHNREGKERELKAAIKQLKGRVKNAESNAEKRRKEGQKGEVALTSLRQQVEEHKVEIDKTQLELKKCIDEVSQAETDALDKKAELQKKREEYAAVEKEVTGAEEQLQKVEDEMNSYCRLQRELTIQLKKAQSMMTQSEKESAKAKDVTVEPTTICFHCSIYIYMNMHCTYTN
eukprot:GHVQ01029932.1.p1 GENE.GHVQ01029932.1~~GHVQ01029932.1.p1  ORF type:complete len:895 (+),score=178.97 GHVQ01029932.1:232-2685(+)